MNRDPRLVIQAVNGKVLLSIASQQGSSPLMHLSPDEAERHADRLMQAAAQARGGIG